MRLLFGPGVCVSVLLLFGQWSEAATIRTSKVGGWTIAVESDDSTKNFSHCKATSTARGAALSFNVTRNMQWNAQVENSDWKFAPDRKFEVYFALEPQSDGPMFRYGAYVAGERKFAVVITEDVSPEHELYVALRKWRSLTIVVDDQINPNVVFQLSGTSDALPALMRCVAQYRKSTGQLKPQRPATRAPARDAARPAQRP